MEALEAAKTEVDNVIAKLDTFSNFSEWLLNETIGYIERIKDGIEVEVGDDNCLSDTDAADLCSAMKRIQALMDKTSADHRGLHRPISGIGRVIDKEFNAAGLGVLKNNGMLGEPPESQILLQSIAQHLYREGLPEVTDALCKEADMSLDLKDKARWDELREILNSLKKRNLEPTRRWISEHQEGLNGQRSALEFKLHRLAFINLAKLGPRFQLQAVNYARNNFFPFAVTHQKDIQVLMGSMAFIRGNLKDSPYSYLVDDSLWDDIVETARKDVCIQLELPRDSPLATCFEAGCTAIPKLLNIFTHMEAGHLVKMFGAQQELPIDIELGPDYVFHSVFPCPILREPTTELNPPMRLSCGHVVSRDALQKLATGNKVKCPYCPGEQNLSDARQITF